MANASTDSGVSDACVFVALALFGVWMQRQKVTTLSGNPTRWGAFFGAISGKYTISSNVSAAPAAPATDTTGSGVGASTSSSGSSTGSVPNIPGTSTPAIGPGSPNPTIKGSSGIIPWLQKTF